MKRLIIALVAMFAVAAGVGLALDGAVEFPDRGHARGDALNYNFALCANKSGSSTVNFEAATTTYRNASFTHADVRLSASVLATNSENTQIVWDVEGADPASIWSGATATVKTAGRYDGDLVLGVYKYAGSPGESYSRTARIKVNGATVAEDSQEWPASMTSVVSTLHVPLRNYRLEVGDTVTAEVYCTGIASVFYLYEDSIRRNWMTLEQVR